MPRLHSTSRFRKWNCASQAPDQLKFGCWVQTVKLSLAPMTCVPCVSLQVFWYTVEFGCVREGDAVKAFGAAILSSYGELEHFATASNTV